MNFETQVVGETRRKTITLTNNGALSTEYEFIRVTGMNVGFLSCLFDKYKTKVRAWEIETTL